MNISRRPWVHVKSSAQILKHFKNPLLITLLRLGLIRLPYFLYRLNKSDLHYSMLARPTTTSMADLFILRDVLINETYSDVLPLLPQQALRIVDIGANLGSFTIWMNRRCGVKEAFCFEPEPDSFKLLNFNLALNECTNAKTFQYAIGGESRQGLLALKQDSPGGTCLYSDFSGNPAAKPISILSFEQLLKGVEGNFDLLKMDCESSEWEILDKTDPDQFKRFPVLLAETHWDPAQNRSVSEFRSLAERLGYRTVRWDNKFHGLYIGTRQ